MHPPVKLSALIATVSATVGSFIMGPVGIHALEADATNCGITSSAIEGAPAIILSQIGYTPKGRKIAILRSDSTAPVEWRVSAANGQTVLSGMSSRFGKNETSGDFVHRIDLSSLTTTGDNYRLKACGEVSRPFSIEYGNQRKVALDTLKYFYHNRSGTPILNKHVSEQKWTRPTAFADNSIATCFSGTDELNIEWPACDYSLDIKGGWFDAGDFGKYVVNGGISVWTLQDAYEMAPTAWTDKSANIPESGNEISDLLDEARYELEFLLSMQIPEGKTVTAARTNADDKESILTIDSSGLVHHKTHAKKWAEFPMRPEASTAEQFLYPPSTAATLNLAAVAAQGARLWQDIDPDFATRSLTAAKRAFEAALREPALFATNRFDGGGAYGDKFVEDEFSWAAAELFATTGDTDYLKHLNFAPKKRKKDIGLLAWPQVRLLTSFTILRHSALFDTAYVEKATRAILEASDKLIRIRDEEGYAFPLSPKGYTWGSTGRIANNAMILGLAYQITNDSKYHGGVVDTVDFLIGRNAIDQSYITGVGHRPFINPHHRFWGHSLDAALPPPPPGAVSGGPNNLNFADDVAKTLDKNCPAQTCWKDDAGAFSLNEVAINWNAPVFWITNFLSETEKK